jgi:hypothetical protein
MRSYPAGAVTPDTLVLLPDYVVELDLPSAYQRVAGISGAPSQTRGRTATPKPASHLSTAEVPVREFQRPDSTHGHVRLRLAEEALAGAFASRVPTGRLETAGFAAGTWLVLTAAQCADLPTEHWVVLLRRNGTFQATGERWTIARIKFLDDAHTRLQLSYGAATGRLFRPERLDAIEVAFSARIVCLADEAP